MVPYQKRTAGRTRVARRPDVVITSLRTRRSRTKAVLAALATTSLCIASADAGIVILGTGSAVTNANSSPGDFTLSSQGPGNRDGIYSYSFAAGATSDMLVVSISTEVSSQAFSVSYGGQAMIQATQSAAGSGTSIWFLADPSPTGSVAIDFTAKSVVNGIGLGIASLNGAGKAIALDNGVSDNGVTSIDITTNFDDSFVMFAGDANTTAGNVSVASPLTTIFAGPRDIGSNQAAAGYENGVSAGGNTYSWNPSSSERGISAAAFYTVPEPSSLALLGLGGLLIARRRRDAAG